MSGLLLQDAVATLIAAAAAATVLRRIVSFARPRAASSPCACASGRSCAAAAKSIPASAAPLIQITVRR
jgi:hypothetical protein